MRGISDGYISFDDQDMYRKVEGPVVVELVKGSGKPYQAENQPGSLINDLFKEHPEYFDLAKPYFVGQERLEIDPPTASQKVWIWDERESP